MSFYKIKLDSNDVLFSKIIRFGKKRCQRCACLRELQCCHIFSRRHYATRFEVRNAIALCAWCHDWFDSHKNKDILFDKRLQEIPQLDNGYYFLVSKLGYTWEELVRLKAKSQGTFENYKARKAEVKKYLEEIFEVLR